MCISSNAGLACVVRDPSEYADFLFREERTGKSVAQLMQNGNRHRDKRPGSFPYDSDIL